MIDDPAPIPVRIDRLPKDLQEAFRELYTTNDQSDQKANTCLQPDTIYCGDARQLLPQIEPNSIALSVWSPPYFCRQRIPIRKTLYGSPGAMRLLEARSSVYA